MKKIFFKFFIASLLFWDNLSYGSWIGPRETIKGLWGDEAVEFGLLPGDTVDIFPKEFGIDAANKVLIADLVNKRVAIYNSDGTISSLIQKPSELKSKMWPGSLLVMPSTNTFLANLYIYNYSGSIITKIVAPKSERTVTPDGYLIHDLDTDFYYLYSPDGKILKTYNSFPLELGKEVSAKQQPDGKYLTTIQYNDIFYNIRLSKPLEYFKRDTNNNLFAIIKSGSGENSYYEVYKFNECSKSLGSVSLPPNEIFINPEQPDIPQPVSDTAIVTEYGQPVIAHNGDVYIWKRTPDTYSILKWTWQDDPNVQSGPDEPSTLEISPSATGLYLTWQASPQDPGCVSGYEISRSDTSGGTFSAIAQVDKGILKYTDTSTESGKIYYYKVRAFSGNDYSPYSAEASGTR